MIQVSSFVKIVSLVYFCFCLLVYLCFIIIDRWTEGTALQLLARSESFLFRRLKPSKADNRTTHCRRHYQTCKSLLRRLLPLAFPFPSSPARVVFSLSPASLRHKEASRREDLQHDSKTLSPVAMIHRELESRPNITTLLCPAIHANEFPVVLIRNVTQTILSNMNSYAKYKLCQI